MEQAKNSSPVLPGDGKGALTPERLRQIGKETGLQHFLVLIPSSQSAQRISRGILHDISEISEDSRLLDSSTKAFSIHYEWRAHCTITGIDGVFEKAEWLARIEKSQSS